MVAVAQKNAGLNVGTRIGCERGRSQRTRKRGLAWVAEAPVQIAFHRVILRLSVDLKHQQRLWLDVAPIILLRSSENRLHCRVELRDDECEGSWLPD